MREATVFRFTGTAYDAAARALSFSYVTEFTAFPPLHFTERIILPPGVVAANVPDDLWRRLVAGLHLLLGVSYWKLYCPPHVYLPYQLSEIEARFWTTVYRKGLGEFFYRNQLDLSSCPVFPTTASQPVPVWLPDKPSEAALIGIGGGKDSFVAAELMREESVAVTAFIVETQRQSPLLKEAVAALNMPVLAVRRELDPQLLEDLPGLHRGHVPVSAIYAWLGYLIAVTFGKKYVAVGNEQSSNEGNIEYQGEVINHQWSKSSEFETFFQDYARQVLTPDVHYFSLLRPFSELRIARMFARYTQYFPVFSSCNRNFTAAGDRPIDQLGGHGRWCCACPKCVFTFLLLAAQLPRPQLLAVFGSNLLDDARLTDIYRDILGFGKLKPFDCVGTFAEARAALYLARKNFADSLAVRKFLPLITDGAELAAAAERCVRAETVPQRFRFAGMETTLLVGYGIEGKATEQFLLKRCPQLIVAHTDQTDGPDYLDRQTKADISVRSPSIEPQAMRGQYTTGSNMFFARFHGVITGITGSKGKSTTASLLQAMLQAEGRSAVLIGNIGTPMLKALDQGTPETIAVVELSSYQLADCDFSPHIAVVTSLFPDHLDYHGSVEAYYAAKKRIITRQRPSDFFVYDPRGPAALWRDKTAAQPVPAAGALPVALSEIPLLGEHNVANVRAATAAARILGVSDDAIAKAIRTFSPLPHRLEPVGDWRGITFYDDAISTTPESTIVALKALVNVKTIFLGGTDRGYDFTALQSNLHTYGIENVVLFPDSGGRILPDRAGFRILETDDMTAAVEFAYAYTPPGSVCLLSCASPSYSLWPNYEAKGDEFQREVRRQGGA